LAIQLNVDHKQQQRQFKVLYQQQKIRIRIANIIDEKFNPLLARGCYEVLVVGNGANMPRLETAAITAN